MDQLRELLNLLREEGLADGYFLGLLHVLIGRRVTLEDGTPVSSGVSWRDLAALLKRVRWDRAAVRELEINPAELPPRDRVRFWYSAIARAGVDSAAAVEAGDRFAEMLERTGYRIGPAPGR